jgi:hypothetical protein
MVYDELDKADVLAPETGSKDRKVFIAKALRHARAQNVQKLILDRIRRELVITYKQAADKKVAEDILAFEDKDAIEYEFDYISELDE